MVTSANRAGGTDEGPDSKKTTERDQGFFAEAAHEFLQPVFGVEVPIVNISKLTGLIWEENQIYDEYVIRSTYSSPSKEDGRGASDAIQRGCGCTGV